MLIVSLFTLVGCSENNKENAGNKEQGGVNEDRDKKDEQEKTDKEPQFKPGNFNPGEFNPGNFNPGDFNPGEFKPGTFKPGTFTPGNFDSSVSVSVEEDEISIEVPSDLLFDFDKSELKSAVIETLDRLSEDLNQYDGANVYISGHTDSQGEEAYNQRLSEDRAKEVQRYLGKKINVETINIEITGYGEAKAIASNVTEEGRAKNRRVEIIVEPLENK